jgi:hypothetical protein
MLQYFQNIVDRHVDRALRRIVDVLNADETGSSIVRSDLQTLSASVAQLAAKTPRFISSSGLQVTSTPEGISVSNSGVTSVKGTANQIIASATSGDITLSTPQNIDTGAAVQFARLGLLIPPDATNPLNIAGKLQVNPSGVPVRSNNIGLVGQGYDLVVASGSALAQAGAVGSVASFTTGAAGGSFEIGGYIDVTAFTAGTISMTCTYTDPSGTPRTLTVPLVSLAGTIGTTVGAATDAQAVVISIQTSGANSITIATTVTVFTGTYSVFAWIRQVV